MTASCNEESYLDNVKFREYFKDMLRRGGVRD